VPDLDLRIARGSAGGRHNLQPLAETGLMSSPQLGMPFLPGARATETEIGADFSLPGSIRGQVTYAAGSRDLYAAPGFASPWSDVGQLSQRSLELSAAIPVLNRTNARWTWPLGYGRSNATVDELSGPPFLMGNMLIRRGERLGTIYGYRFITGCAELPAPFAGAATCGGATTDFQVNDDGYLVWVGNGNSWRDGVSGALWGTSTNTGTPWGVTLGWGMPIILRDTLCISSPSANCPGQQVALGNALPDWQFSVGTTLRARRFTLQALIHGVMGRDVWNQGRQWSYLLGTTSELDQAGKSPETAKPIGYYWRAGPTDGFSGLGGLYHILSPNSHFVESTSYARLKELAVSYAVGQLLGAGDWIITLTGRNLLTISDYRGIDPEVPFVQNGNLSDSDVFLLPQARTIGVSLTARF
jgi:hypothetical protein